MENNTDFDFYLKFTKPLILNLPQINDRVLAAAWVRKLVESTADEKIKLDYLKLLLFVLQRKKLAAPFTEHPNTVDELSNFSAGHSLVEVAKRIIEKENEDKREKARKRLQGQSGDFPPYVSDFSADLLEYVAVQYIDDFGVHGYYAVSKQPLNQWHRIDKQLLPKAAKSMIEVSAGPTTLTGALSSPQLTEVQPERSPQTEGPREGIPEEPGEPTTPSPPKKRETPKRSTLGASPPSRIIGKTPLPEDREPPTWGSNLLEVKHVLEDGGDAGDLFATSSFTDDETTEVLWTSGAGSPMYDNFDDLMGQTPPSFMDTSLAGEAGSPARSPSRSAWSSAASLPYLTPRYPTVTPPPPGKPTPPSVVMGPPRRPFPQAKPTRASLLLQKKTAQQMAPPPPPPVRRPVVRTSTPIVAPERPSGARYLATSAQSKKAPSSKPSKSSLLASSAGSRGVPSKPSKSSIPGSPTGASYQPSKSSLPVSIGSKGARSRSSRSSVPRPSASKESALRRTGAVARTSRSRSPDAYSPPGSTAAAFRGFADDDDGEVTKHLEEYNKMLSEIEAQYIHDVAEYAKLWPAKETPGSKTESARHAKNQRNLSRLAKSSLSPTPSSHGSPVPLERSISISGEARTTLQEVADSTSPRGSAVHSPLRNPVPRLSSSQGEDDFEEMERMVEEELRSQGQDPSARERRMSPVQQLSSPGATAQAQFEALTSSPGHGSLRTSPRSDQFLDLGIPTSLEDALEERERNVEEEMLTPGQDPKAGERSPTPSRKSAGPGAVAAMDPKIVAMYNQITETTPDEFEAMERMAEEKLPSPPPDPVQTRAQAQYEALKSSPGAGKDPRIAAVYDKMVKIMASRDEEDDFEAMERLVVDEMLNQGEDPYARARDVSPAKTPSQSARAAADAQYARLAAATPSRSGRTRRADTQQRPGQTPVQVLEAAFSEHADVSARQGQVQVFQTSPARADGTDDFEDMERMIEEQMRREGQDPHARGKKKGLSRKQLAATRKQLVAMHSLADAQLDDLSQAAYTGADATEDFETIERMIEEDMRREGQDPHARGKKKGLSQKQLAATRRQLVAMHSRADAQLDDLGPSAGTPEVDPETQRAIMENLQLLHGKMAPKTPFVKQMTPPMFSRHREIREAATGVRYQDEDEEQWVWGPDFFANEPKLPRSKDPREKPFEFLFPAVDVPLFESPIGENQPPDEFLELSPPPPSQQEALGDIYKMYDEFAKAVPGFAGVPVTVPRPSLSPRRFFLPFGIPLANEISPLKARETPQGTPVRALQRATPLSRAPPSPSPPYLTQDVFLTSPPQGLPSHSPTWYYESPEVQGHSLKSLHRRHHELDQISPQRLQSDIMEERDLLRHKLFGIPLVPTVFDFPADQMGLESPPHLVSPERSPLSPPIDAEQLKDEIEGHPGEQYFTPYKRTVLKNKRVPHTVRRRSDPPTVQPVEEFPELLTEEEREIRKNIVAARARRLPRKVIGPVKDEQGKLRWRRFPPPRGMPPIEEVTPPKEGPDVFDMPGIRPVQYESPPEFASPVISPLLSPPILPDLFGLRVVLGARDEYKTPYRKKVTAKHFVDRKSPAPALDTVPEWLENLEEEDWEKRNWIQFKEKPEKKEFERIRAAPGLETITEHIEYPPSPITTRPAPASPGVPGPRRKQLRKKLAKKKIDFTQPSSPNESQMEVEEFESRIEDRMLPEEFWAQLEAPPRHYERPDFYRLETTPLATAADDLSPRTPRVIRLEEEEFPEGYFTPPSLVKEREIPIEERAARIRREVEAEIEAEMAALATDDSAERRRLRTHFDSPLPPGLASPMTPENIHFYQTPPHLKRKTARPPKKELNIMPSRFRNVLYHEERPDDFIPYETPSPPLATSRPYFLEEAEYSPMGVYLATQNQGLRSPGIATEELPEGFASPVSPVQTAREVQALADYQYAQLGSPTRPKMTAEQVQLLAQAQYNQLLSSEPKRESPARRTQNLENLEDLDEFERFERLAEHDINLLELDRSLDGDEFERLEAMVAGEEPEGGERVVTVVPAKSGTPSRAQQIAAAQYAALGESPAQRTPRQEVIEFDYQEKVTENQKEKYRQAKRREAQAEVEYEREALEELGLSETDLSNMNLNDMQQSPSASSRQVSPESPGMRQMYERLKGMDSKPEPKIKGRPLPAKYKKRRARLPNVTESEDEYKRSPMGWNMRWDLSPEARVNMRVPDVHVEHSPLKESKFKFELVHLKEPPPAVHHRPLPLAADPAALRSDNVGTDDIHLGISHEMRPELVSGFSYSDMFDGEDGEEDINRFEDAEMMFDEGPPEGLYLAPPTPPSPIPYQSPQPASPSQLKGELDMHEYYDPDRRSMTKTIRVKGKKIPLRGAQRPGLSPVYERTPPVRRPMHPSQPPKTMEEIMAQADAQYAQLMGNVKLPSPKTPSPDRLKRRVEKYKFSPTVYKKEWAAAQKPQLSPSIEEEELEELYERAEQYAALEGESPPGYAPSIAPSPRSPSPRYVSPQRSPVVERLDIWEGTEEAPDVSPPFISSRSPSPLPVDPKYHQLIPTPEVPKRFVPERYPPSPYQTEQELPQVIPISQRVRSPIVETPKRFIAETAEDRKKMPRRRIDFVRSPVIPPSPQTPESESQVQVLTVVAQIHAPPKTPKPRTPRTPSPLPRKLDDEEMPSMMVEQEYSIVEEQEESLRPFPIPGSPPIVPFGGRTSPGIYDTSPISYEDEIPEELRDFKWMDR